MVVLASCAMFYSTFIHKNDGLPPIVCQELLRKGDVSTKSIWSLIVFTEVVQRWSSFETLFRLVKTPGKTRDTWFLESLLNVSLLSFRIIFIYHNKITLALKNVTTNHESMKKLPEFIRNLSRLNRSRYGKSGTELLYQRYFIRFANEICIKINRSNLLMNSWLYQTPYVLTSSSLITQTYFENVLSNIT